MTPDIFPREFLARLAPTREVPHPGAFATAPMPEGLDAAVAQFTAAIEAVGGRVSRVASTGEAADIVLGYLEAPDWRTHDQQGPGPFVAWDAAYLPLPDVATYVESRGARRLDATVRTAQADRDEDYRRLDAAVVGITGAHAGLADTGSLALIHGDGRGRLVSLLPPVHVAIVELSRLRATLGALLADEPDLLTRAANVVFVTGPSRTADIEMTLTRGVHGPRIVHVVWVG